MVWSILLEITVCDSYPCLNDGTCSESTDSTSGYKCQCLSGYSGDNCEGNIVFSTLSNIYMLL